MQRHALTDRDRKASASFRSAAAAGKGRLGPDMRGEFAAMMAATPAADGVTYERASVGSIAGSWCVPRDAAPHAAILYVHGGAYVMGSGEVAQHLAGQIAVRAGVAALAVDYRLAPEHAFPSAVDDARTAYRELVAAGYTTITLVGDSAGGGLTLVLSALAVAPARETGSVRPRAVAVMSPWADLSLGGASLVERADADPLLTKDALASCAELYLRGHDARDPLASPLFGTLADLPPTLIVVGEDEILLDDAVRYGERARVAGSDVAVQLWEGMPHVFPSMIGTFEASMTALDTIGRFLRERLLSA